MVRQPDKRQSSQSAVTFSDTLGRSTGTDSLLLWTTVILYMSLKAKTKPIRFLNNIARGQDKLISLSISIHIFLVFCFCFDFWDVAQASWGHMHKTLCRSLKKTAIWIHSFCQIYKPVLCMALFYTALSLRNWAHMHEPPTINQKTRP